MKTKVKIGGLVLSRSVAYKNEFDGSDEGVAYELLATDSPQQWTPLGTTIIISLISLTSGLLLGLCFVQYPF